MAFPSENGGGKCVVGGLRTLVRRKQVDSKHTESSSSSRSGQNQLAKALTVPHLIAIGKILCYIGLILLNLRMFSSISLLFQELVLQLVLEFIFLLVQLLESIQGQLLPFLFS